MPFWFGRRKVKVYTVDFAQGLDWWLSRGLGKRRVKRAAKDFSFKIKSDEDFQRIFGELLALNTWLIVRACERLIKDVDKRNECLDIFHRLVYVRYAKGTEQNFGEWMKFMGGKYIEYMKAVETEHPSGPLWVLAKVVNKNLFGEVKENAFVQAAIGGYLGINMKYTEEAIKELIKKYDIVVLKKYGGIEYD